MEINGSNISQTMRQTEGERQFANLKDGVNDAVEISLLPIMDSFVGMAIPKCADGKAQLGVHNEVFRKESGEYKPLMKMDYVMRKNMASQLESKGLIQGESNEQEITPKITIDETSFPRQDEDGLGFYTREILDNGSGVTIFPRTTVGDFKVNVSMDGSAMSTDAQGKINGQEVNQNYTFDLNPFDPQMKISGNIAGVSFERSSTEIGPGTLKFKGTFDGKEENTEVSMAEDGLDVTRTFGDYMIKQHIAIGPDAPFMGTV